MDIAEFLDFSEWFEVADVASLDPDAAIQQVVKLALRPVVEFGARAIVGHWNLAERMPHVNRAWRTARRELEEVGLLYDANLDSDDLEDSGDDGGSGGYLDQIELEIASLPSIGEAGYVYEEMSWLPQLCGFRAGVIYLPVDLPREAYVPGHTLTDVIRHEYAHAWHWLDPEFFGRSWFRRAFGGEYEDDDTRPIELFEDRLAARHRRALARCRTDRERDSLTRRLFRNDFVSEYASTYFCEDFAETFMVYLRHRNNLDRFAGRPGVFRKLTAIREAVARARRELGN